MKNKSKR